MTDEIKSAGKNNTELTQLSAQMMNSVDQQRKVEERFSNWSEEMERRLAEIQKNKDEIKAKMANV